MHLWAMVVRTEKIGGNFQSYPKIKDQQIADERQSLLARLQLLVECSGGGDRCGAGAGDSEEPGDWQGDWPSTSDGI